VAIEAQRVTQQDMVASLHHYTCLVLAIIVALAAKLWPWAGWSTVALFMFGATLLMMTVRSPRALVLTSPIYLLWASELFSGVLIEHGAYLEEARQRGGTSGGFAQLTALYIGLLAFMSLIIERVLNRREVNRRYANFVVARPVAFVVVGLFVASSAYAVYIGLRNGFPLLSGLDRLEYREILSDSIFEAWHSNRVILAFLFGMIAAGGWRLLGLTMLVALTLISLLFSEKFTSLLLMFCFFSMIPGLKLVAKVGRLPLSRSVIPLIFIAALSMPATFFVYGGANRSAQAWQQTKARMAVQGQAWYLVELGKVTDRKAGLSVLARDVSSWVNPESQNPRSAGTTYGHYYVMQSIAPEIVLKDFQSNGVGFVFLLFPYLYLLGGIWGVILGGLLISGVVALVFAALGRTAAQNDYVSVVICLKLAVWQISGFLLGYLWYFFGIKALLLFCGLAASAYFHFRWTESRHAVLHSRRIGSLNL
jgi:Family of unknown function (DUF6418)